MQNNQYHPINYARCNLVAGAPGYGKSTFGQRYIDTAKHFPNALVYLEDIDCYGKDVPFAKFPLIQLKDYKGGRVRINSSDIEYPAFMKLVDKYYRNGILLIDEGGLYEKHTISDHLMPVLKKRRKVNVDVTLNYHGVRELPLASFKYINNLVLFFQTEEFAKRADVPRMADILAARDRIFNEVMKKGNKYYHEVIKFS